MKNDRGVFIFNNAKEFLDYHQPFIDNINSYTNEYSFELIAKDMENKSIVWHVIFNCFNVDCSLVSDGFNTNNDYTNNGKFLNLKTMFENCFNFGYFSTIKQELEIYLNKLEEVKQLKDKLKIELNNTKVKIIKI